MKRSKLIKRIALLAAVAILLGGGLQTTLGYLIANAGPLVNIFVPYLPDSNDLVIEKEATHTLGAEYDAEFANVSANTAFNFKVTLSDYYKGATLTLVNSTDQVETPVTVNDQNELYLSMKPTESVTIKGIEKDDEVKVEEILDPSSGYQVKGENERTVKIEDNTLVLSYLNIYSAYSTEQIDINVTKQFTGDGWRGDEKFTFVLNRLVSDSNSGLLLKDKLAQLEVSYADIEKSYLFDNVMPSFSQVGSYAFCIDELDAAGNVIQSKSFTVEVTSSDNEPGKLNLQVVGLDATLNGTTILAEALFVNDKNMARTNISVSKVWQDSEGNPMTPPAVDVVVELLANGSGIGQTLTLNDANGWQNSFNDLPVNDASGNPIAYSVQEVAVSGYTSVVSGDMTSGFVITNTEQSTPTPPPVKPDPPKDIEEVSAVAFAVHADKLFDGTIPGRKFFNFELRDSDGNLVESVQNNVGGYIHFWPMWFNKAGTYTYTLSEIPGDNEHIVYDPSVYTLEIVVSSTTQKFVRGGQNVKLTTCRFESITWYKDGEFYSDNAENQTPDKPVFENYTATSVTVKKKWVGKDENRPIAAMIQLYGNGEAYGDPVLLEEANGWTYTWEKLRGDKEMTWTVEELSVPDNYLAEVSAKGKNRFIVTNTFVTNVTVDKVWVGEDENRPAHAMIQLYADGEAYGDPILLDDANGWTYTWEKLDIDVDWTVEEIEVAENYEVQITREGDHFTVTNTYVPPVIPDEPDVPDEPDTPDTPDEPDVPDEPDTPDEPKDPDDTDDTPKTSDDSHTTLWFVLMLTALFGMVCSGIIARMMTLKAKKRF